jgi:hypothetical protein
MVLGEPFLRLLMPDFSHDLAKTRSLFAKPPIQRPR